MLSGFKTFIARGNVVDLAVGVVMGAAFGLVVSGLVESFINPLIAWLVGKPNFDSLVFSLPPLIGEEPTVFEYGKFDRHRQLLPRFARHLYLHHHPDEQAHRQPEKRRSGSAACAAV